MKIHVKAGKAKLMQNDNMSEKIKRKGTPPNLRHYWQIFGLIAILLIIPFRVVPYWTAMLYTYIAISIFIGLSTLRFIWRYGLRRWILVLMLICMLLPIGQMMSISNERVYQAHCYTNQDLLVTSITCGGGCAGSPYNSYITVKGIPISIFVGTGYGGLACLF